MSAARKRHDHHPGRALPGSLVRVPLPGSRVLWGRPTVVNNLETLAMVPAIVARGGKWFSSIGSKGNAGTKVISVNGSVSGPAW